jgi:hypothetical protein
VKVPSGSERMRSFIAAQDVDRSRRFCVGRRFQSVTELRRELHRYVRCYNRKRLHSALSYHSPVDCEKGAA